MKKRSIRIVEILVVIICFMLLVDNVFNGMFLNWLASILVFQGLDPSYIRWDIIKKIIVGVILFGAPCIYLLCCWYIERCMEKERYKLRQDVLALMEDTTDTVHLHNDYAGIETGVMKLKFEAIHQRELYEKESSRKNDLITYLAHDLKTPLASVIGYLSFLSEATEITVALKEKYTNIALDKAYRLETLIDQFFEITRFNLQTIVINREKMDIRLMLEQLCDECYPILKNCNKEIHMEIEDEGQVYLDPDKFGRVLTNVLRNAISYSYENTPIQLKEHIEHKQLIIQVINEGDRIPAHKLETIFEKFYRMDEARSTRKGGAGLGLAIAKSIIEAHQGTISAKSDEHYTTFTMMIPLHA